MHIGTFNSIESVTILLTAIRKGGQWDLEKVLMSKKKIGIIRNRQSVLILVLIHW